VFRGYYKQPDATRDTMTESGLVSAPATSGFVDRRGSSRHRRPRQGCRQASRRYPVRTRNSSRNKLKFSPFVAEAVALVIGGRLWAAIVAIDLTTVGNWAEKRRNLAYTSFQDLRRQGPRCDD